MKIDSFEYYDELNTKSLRAVIRPEKGDLANQKTLFKGVNALILFAKHAEQTWGGYFERAEKLDLLALTYFPEFYYLINEVNYITSEIENSKHQDDVTKIKLTARLEFIFKCKLSTPVAIVIKAYNNRNKSENDDLFKEIERIYHKISAIK